MTPERSKARIAELKAQIDDMLKNAGPDCCCCGDSLDHSPWSAGHTPVSAHAYHTQHLRDEIENLERKQKDDDPTLVTVWILTKSYSRPPFETSARLHTTGKQNWAVLDDGVRHYVGSTAFFTESAATKRYQGELDRVRKSSYMKRMFPRFVDRANRLCKVNVYGNLP